MIGPSELLLTETDKDRFTPVFSEAMESLIGHGSPTFRY